MTPEPSRVDWIYLLVVFALSSAWCLSAAARLGATFDEPTYIAAGLDRWRTGRVGGLMRLGTMPLPIDVITFPPYAIERARGVPFRITTDEESRPVDLTELSEVLRMARAGTLVFWSLLLYYGWRTGWDVAGPWGGRLALTVLASEPNLLAHASLATTDVAVAACLLAFVYRFRIGRNESQWARIVVPGIWFALALLSKATALLFAPLCLLAVAVWTANEDGKFDRGIAEPGARWRICRGPRRGTRGGVAWWAALRPARHDATQIFAIGIALTFLYCGSDWQREESFVAWASELPRGPIGTLLSFMADNLAIFSNAGEGLVQQIKHNVRGHDTYLLGQTYERAIWYYFPVALTMKLTTPVICAALLLAFVRPRALWNYAFLTAAVLIVSSVLVRVQIGIRVMLPAVAFLNIGLASAAIHAVGSIEASLHAQFGHRFGWQEGRRRISIWVAAGVMLLALASNSVTSWPNGLTFFNALWGGSSKGYLYLSDSNYDWGQGLPELRRWQEKHRAPNLAVWYWGTDPSSRNGPWQLTPLHARRIESTAELIAQLRGKHLAASTTLVYGSLLADTADGSPEIERMKRTMREIRHLLQSRAPAARTATFLIYDFTKS